MQLPEAEFRSQTTVRPGQIVPEEILAEHSLHNRPSAIDRLLSIGAEIAAAAKAGDTARIRILKAEKKNLELAEQRQVATVLASAPTNRYRAPARGEETKVSKREKHLQSEIVRARTKREKFLKFVGDDPENEDLLAELDAVDRLLRDCDEELQEIAARQSEIEQWHREEERRESDAAKRDEQARKAPSLLAKLESEVRRVVAAHKRLDAGLLRINELLGELEDRAVAAKVYAQVREATDSSVIYDSAGWHVAAARRTR